MRTKTKLWCGVFGGFFLEPWHTNHIVGGVSFGGIVAVNFFLYLQAHEERKRIYGDQTALGDLLGKATLANKSSDHRWHGQFIDNNINHGLEYVPYFWILKLSFMLILEILR